MSNEFWKFFSKRRMFFFGIWLSLICLGLAFKTKMKFVFLEIKRFHEEMEICEQKAKALGILGSEMSSSGFPEAEKAIHDEYLKWSPFLVCPSGGKFQFNFFSKNKKFPKATIRDIGPSSCSYHGPFGKPKPWNWKYYFQIFFKFLY